MESVEPLAKLPLANIIQSYRDQGVQLQSPVNPDSSGGRRNRPALPRSESALGAAPLRRGFQRGANTT